VRRRPVGFELRHRRDREADEPALRVVTPEALRDLAQRTVHAHFRPLKSAPTLPAGWRCVVRRPEELARALECVYPGTLGDWHAAAAGHATGADFAGVAARQVGRAKALQQLQGEGLSAVVGAACGVTSCLKRRVWRAEGVPDDEAGGKGVVPCLEPCPVFLRFARACTETESRVTVPGRFAPDDLATLAAALRHALDQQPSDVRPGDVSAPLHPWRVARLLARHGTTWSQAGSTPSDPDE